MQRSMTNECCVLHEGQSELIEAEEGSSMSPQAPPLVAPPSLRFHLMNCPSVRFRTFRLKYVHCGNAVTPIDVASGPVLRSFPFAAGALHVL
jgi:hypothetical protein